MVLHNLLNEQKLELQFYNIIQSYKLIFWTNRETAIYLIDISKNQRRTSLETN